jgi:NADP-dependent 3-hydroxy acid dehydrogenase YdfG
MLSPHGRLVMISGASRGIGGATLQRLLDSGCTVSAGVRDPARLAGIYKTLKPVEDPKLIFDKMDECAND